VVVVDRAPQVGAPLLTVEDLSVTFEMGAGEPAHAVRSVSFDLKVGEILGLVGESGSGKSVTCMSLLRLLPENAKIDGKIDFGGKDILSASSDELRTFRATDARIIFQDPASSMNPLMRVGRQITESIGTTGDRSPAESRASAIEMLRRVGIGEAERRYDMYPHEMSGGMLQRIMIAMALAASPRLLICDEPTTALDVTTEAQILELIRGLNKEFGTSVIFTTHDLGLVREVCDRVIVMYQGTVVETAHTEACLSEPWHPYTSLLLSAEPESAPPDATRLQVIKGSPPRATDHIGGCPFHPRCPAAETRCTEALPPLMPVPDRSGHDAACWVTLEKGPIHV
jgi:oligopeptide/dipeptide ABC transporter ATP-binding protein